MANKVYSATVFALKNSLLSVVLLIASLGLAVAFRQPLERLPSLVDWNTIITLSGLLMVTTGIKESGLFYLLAYRLCQRIDRERFLALLLVFLSAILAMFLTNDIALFIMVPLTLSLQQITENDYSKIIIFEAIAVNVGSSLTPIGNPQNIFLWHRWDVSFLLFAKEMAPLVLMMSLWLSVMTLLCFSPREIRVANRHYPTVNRGLFILCSLLLVAFIIAVELDYERYFLAVVFVVLLLSHRNVILKTDWGLIFLFILIFIDLNLICRFQAVHDLLSRLNFNHIPTLFLSGAFFSQVISNVPATILLANYSTNFKIIAYAVNIGGNGLLISSLANLIALRFSQKRSNYLVFHAYSLSFFMISLISSYYLFT
ncbi:MAG: anion transporter [Deltaproteobacteria bacterium]|nr:anion transporter [Deltaproteobacteria bacterium]MBW2071566.1 anion transporter [Deltaproteobacteria bacterium]